MRCTSSRDLPGPLNDVEEGHAPRLFWYEGEASLASVGARVSVVGTRLDVAYPPENRELQRRIAAEHLLLSQFPPGTPVSKRQFPQRNRTMALLLRAAVIVEANDGSGTLSLAWEALRLGRALFVMRSAVGTLDTGRVTSKGDATSTRTPRGVLTARPGTRAGCTASRRECARS